MRNWPCVHASGEHMIDVRWRLRTEITHRILIMIWVMLRHRTLGDIAHQRLADLQARFAVEDRRHFLTAQARRPSANSSNTEILTRPAMDVLLSANMPYRFSDATIMFSFTGITGSRNKMFTRGDVF